MRRHTVGVCRSDSGVSWRGQGVTVVNSEAIWYLGFLPLHNRIISDNSDSVVQRPTDGSEQGKGLWGLIGERVGGKETCLASDGQTYCRELSMHIEVQSSIMSQIKAYSVIWDIAIGPGSASFMLDGMLGDVASECAARVRTAISNSGFTFPTDSVITCTPVDLTVGKSGYDLTVPSSTCTETGPATVKRITIRLTVPSSSASGLKVISIPKFSPSSVLGSILEVLPWRGSLTSTTGNDSQRAR
jgi:hypothetical protein